MLDKSVSLTTFKKIVSEVGITSNKNLSDPRTQSKTDLVSAINGIL